MADSEDDDDDDVENESVFLSLNPITNASGSSYVQLGLSGNESDDDDFDGGKKTTKIFVSVFGPKKTTTRQQDECVSKTRGTIDVSVKVASFATKKRAISSSSSTSLSDVETDFTEKVAKCLRGVVVLESFPKAVVEVRCVVADAHGDELRGLILAASAALMHARVEMRDVLCACTAVIDEDGEVRLVEDYNNSSSGGRKTSKNKKAVGAVTVAYMPRVKKMTNILSVGRWENANDLKKAEEVAMDGCESVAEIIKAAF
jgi:exosome complex component RRP41